MRQQLTVTTQPLAKADSSLGRAVCTTQPPLRMLVFKSPGAHREDVTLDGEPVTDNGEEVWVMVPDA